MNKFKLTILALLVAVFTSLGTVAHASGVGYLDYKKVMDNYSYAQDIIKQVDAKGLELQQFLVDKEKEFKALDTPVKKKNFEEKTKKDFDVKRESYLKFKSEKEDAVFTKIQDAAKTVMVEQKLDAILDYRVIFVGGLDITDMVIDKLKK